MNKLKQKIKDRLGEKKTAALIKAFNITRIIKNVVCWVLIAVLAVAVIVFMFTKINGETPQVFGYTLHRIVSGSMKPELEVGDVIVSKEIKDISEIGVGDIITFQGDARFDDQKVTHRVLVAPYDNGRGATVIVTKGDANIEDDGEISVSSVESKYLSKFDFLKKIYDFFFTPWGLLVFIFVLLLVFFDEIMNIIRLSAQSAKENNDETIYEIIERVQKEQQADSDPQALPESENLVAESSAEENDKNLVVDSTDQQQNTEKTETLEESVKKKETEKKSAFDRKKRKPQSSSAPSKTGKNQTKPKDKSQSKPLSKKRPKKKSNKRRKR